MQMRQEGGGHGAVRALARAPDGKLTVLEAGSAEPLAALERRLTEEEVRQPGWLRRRG